jgi:hypothetical protein
MLSLTPGEVQSLIRKGVIIPPKPVDTASISTLRGRAWRELNPEKYAAYRAKAKAKEKSKEMAGKELVMA